MTPERSGVRTRNGRFYAVARYGHGKQLELAIPSARDEDEAKARSKAIADAAEAFARIGRRDLVRKWARELATAANDTHVAKVQKAIEKIVSGERAVASTGDITFEDWSHAGQLRAHDMRATFVTISLAEGKTDTWIRDRTAHKSTSMIERYRRHARQIAELELGSLVSLVDALGWEDGGGFAPSTQGGHREGAGRPPKNRVSGTDPSPRKYRRRDSNPHVQRTADFESAASTDSATSARGEISSRLARPRAA